MSVIVIGHMTVERANLEKVWAERKADFEAVAADAKAHGASHHRWGYVDGHAVIIDEWADAASFNHFFESQATIPELMQAAGVQGPPQFEIVEALTGPDEF